MSKKYKVAILGATGLVGETLMEILEQRKFPIEELTLLASKRSAGKRLNFAGKSHKVIDVATYDFKDIDIAFFSAGGSVSQEFAPIAGAAGAVVIDNTSAFRYDDDIPLIVPEVNADRISDYKNRNIIANPNCSTIQIMLALKPILDEVGLERVNIATYQAVSGAGRTAMERLSRETAQLMNAKGAEGDLSRQFAFNVIPEIDVMQDNGYTKEEMKMVWETRKILGQPDLAINPTAARVPVFFGHSAALHIETLQKISADKVMNLLKKAPGVEVVDEREPVQFPTALSHAANNDATYVGRIREDISHPKGLNMWVVADNFIKYFV